MTNDCADITPDRGQTSVELYHTVGQRKAVPLPARPSAYRRAENEDDDGYDPWSDRIEETPLFEENPWD